MQENGKRGISLPKGNPLTMYTGERRGGRRNEPQGEIALPWRD